MEFVAIDFETTGYEDGGKNEPWQLGAAVVRDFEIVETREWFFGTPITPDFEPLIEAIVKNGLSPTIISESAGTQSEDAMIMKKILTDKAGK